MISEPDPSPELDPAPAAERVRRVLLSPRRGAVELKVGPPPVLSPGEVLIRTAFSVVSGGTERAKIEFASRGLLAKARSRPDLVRQVLDSLRRDGPSATMRAVRRRLSQPVPLGYSSAGTVLAVGHRVERLAPGDRVAAGGGGYAVHADVVAVPKHLVAPVPSGVPLPAAAFATLGAVGVHAFRLSEASVGATVAVVGLGPVGLLTGLVARAAGCRVVGLDVRPEAVDRARAAGFDRAFSAVGAVEDAVREVTEGRGVDAVLVCAAARSNDPVVLAGRIARDRARVVLVGDVPVQAPRDLLYRKELQLVVARSYGPGRYDPAYEEGGHDYPAGYVRWTEQRNMVAFLQLLADGALDVLPLITHRFPLGQAQEGYRVVSATPGAVVVFDHGDSATEAKPPAHARPRPSSPTRTGVVRVGVIGGGSFAGRVLLPALRRARGAEVVGVATLRGHPAPGSLAPAAASAEELLADPDVDAVVIATRHGSHASLTTAALEAGKAVFVEKPLALSTEELRSVTEAWERYGLPVQVGFNRRWAPQARRLRDELAKRSSPAVVSVRVNAGPLEPGHWAADLEVGGGRILGEMCHFVDLAGFLLDVDPVEVTASAARTGTTPQGAEDVAAAVRYEDGSLGIVTYVALGDVSLGKERVEAFWDGSVFVIEDWRRVSVSRGGKTRSERHRADKGYAAEMEAFLRSAREGGGEDRDFMRSVRSTAATLAVVQSLSLGAPVEL